MAQIIERPQVDLRIVFQINEAEARALDALVGYGDDAFIKVFYDKLGKAYMDKHESALRSFFKDLRTFLPAALSRVDEARRTFEKP